MGYLLKRLLKWYYNFQLKRLEWDIHDCNLELQYYTSKSTYLYSIKQSETDFYNKKLRELRKLW